MLELLAYLRARGFSNWIVTGGGVEFGRLDRGLELAAQNDWSLVSLRRDWSQVFPASPAKP